MCVTMYKKQTSTVALQSQKWIAEALLRLLEQYGFKEITVTQICQEAGLVRKTFYRNFNTKEDILHYIIDQLFLSFQTVFDIRTTPPIEIFTHYYEYWAKEKRLLTLLHRDDLFYLLTKKYVEYVDSMNLYFFQPQDDSFTELESYVVRFIAGGMVSILEHWLECGFSESIENLTTLTGTLLVSANTYLNSTNSTS